MRSFVIVVDMQRDFVEASGALPVPDAEAIVAPMQQWLAALTPAETAGVLLTFDTHDPVTYAASSEARQFPIHCDKATPGWQRASGCPSRCVRPWSWWTGCRRR